MPQAGARLKQVRCRRSTALEVLAQWLWYMCMYMHVRNPPVSAEQLPHIPGFEPSACHVPDLGQNTKYTLAALERIIYRVNCGSWF